MPGFGHFYAGAGVRGIVIMIGFYIVMPVLASVHGAIAIVCWPIAVVFVTRDAWLCAKAENLKELAEIAAGAAPRRWLLWIWAACRALWITAAPGLFGIGMLITSGAALKQGAILHGLILGAYACAPLFLVWWAARETWLAVTGVRSVTESALKTEIGTTVLVTGFCALLLAIAAPAFSGLFRKSAEGGIKGNLGELRLAVDRYRREHDGRAPDSIGAMVAAKTIPEIPRLWRRFDESPHSQTAEASVVADRTATDSGRWAFVVSPSSPSLTGTLFIDCTHTDTRGRFWSEY